MVKIRLMRIGAKKRPFYRVVAVDERLKRNGTYLELLGTYNPLTTPHEVKLNQDRIDFWIKQGAQMSVGFLRVIGKAPQRAPRKPKKEQPEETKPVAEATPAAEVTASAEVTEEAPQTEQPAPIESGPVSEQATQTAEEPKNEETSQEETTAPAEQPEESVSTTEPEATPDEVEEQSTEEVVDKTEDQKA